MGESPIDRFVSALRRRLNRFRFFDLLIRLVLVTGAGLFAVSLAYVGKGYAVPKVWHLGVAVGLPLALFLVWRWTRRNDEDAARFADRHFGLKDAVSSHRHFRRERRSGEVYDLQARETAALVEGLDLEKVSYSFPRRLASATFVLALVCGLLAFKAPSPEVVERLRVAEETERKTEEINEFLQTLAEELEETDDPKALDPKELKEWVAAVKETGDRNEALRQYAELERKMQEAARRLDQRREEHLLAKAGEELQKAEEQEPRALGRKLSEKKLREAADDLAKLSPKEADPEKLDERRKELAKLKSAAQRMAAAAADASRSASSGSSGKGADAAKASASSGKGGKGAAEGQGGAGKGGSGGEDGLEELLSKLDQSVSTLDESLAAASREKSAQGQCSSKTLGQCQSNRDDVLSNLKKLSDSLCRSAARSECRSKLLSMCQKLGQCQGYLGESKFPSLSECLGQGKGIGNGSVESRREGGDTLAATGQTSQLQGIKGQGPSETTVEAADDGDGVSSRRQSSGEREFRQQVESFVLREDVPDDVKEGVKVYFERIHQTVEK